MSIRLPSYDELTQDEQRPAYNLPLNRNYLVKGAPGTGKSIIALYRAARFKDKGSSADVKFLVFNKTLRKYLEQAVVQLDLANSSVDNWHRWFNNSFMPWYNRTFSAHLTIQDTFDGKDPGWDTICANVQRMLVDQRPENWDHLVLDEAQDLPSGLIRLLSLLTRSATIFADQHQRILESSRESIIQDIMNYFSIDQGAVYYLTRNFRNSEEISKVAQSFYVGLTGDLPAHAFHHGPKPRLTLSTGIDATAELIANIADNNPGSHVGVILPPTKSLQAYYKAVSSKTDTAAVQLYQTTDRDDRFNFDETGVKIMSYNVMKGLEFDFVIIPELSAYADNEHDHNILYVASTRAQRELIYVYTAPERNSFVVKTLQSLNETEHFLDEDAL
jgi:DNA helicase IV